MITLKKDKSKDFIVLNLTDLHIGNDEWTPENPHRIDFTYTVETLIERTKPDLITISGDISGAGSDTAYEEVGNYMASLGIPWAVVWGNHDLYCSNKEYLDSMLNKFVSHKNCLYEAGDASLGYGNYVIAIEEEGRIVEGLIMMDSHDRCSYIDNDGIEHMPWAKLYPEQLEWYKQQITELRKKGCCDTSIIMHIPPNAFSRASSAAFRADVKPADISLEDSYKSKCWNPGYENSFGVQHEPICCYPVNDNVLDTVIEMGSTKHIIVGHDHTNNTAIKYCGVWLVYSTKTGEHTPINGGTVLRITSNGVCDVHHEYVDTTSLGNKN